MFVSVTTDLPTVQIFAACTKEFDVSGDVGAIVAITILSLFGAFLVAGTVVEICIALRNPNKKQDSTNRGGAHTAAVRGTANSSFIHDGEGKGQKLYTEESPGNDENPDVAPREHSSKAIRAPIPLWQRLLLAFSIPRNADKILSVKSSPGSIGCLHGIRVLSLSWVILGHFIFFGVVLGNVDNPLDVFTKLSPYVSFQIITGAYLAVDTFFVLSGFLTCYLFLSKLGQKARITVKEFIMYYVHRYLRLTPSMMIWIMIVACLLKYVGNGKPAWDGYTVSGCKDRWWANLLYINNLHKEDPDCLGITWYLACDMQFYIVAPLALIPWLYGKKVIGFIMAGLLLCVHIFTTLFLEIDHTSDNFKDAEVYNDKIYFKPYTRVGPYAIGLMLGWVLWKRKCQVKMNKFVTLVGWVVCLTTILALTLGKHDDLKQFPLTSWPDSARIFYETMSRPIWAAAIGWIIFACATGNGGYVNSILSWDGWLPLSRLSYSGYLVHLTIILYEASFAEQQYLMTMTSLSYTFIGYFVMTYAVGFLLSIVVESPTLALEKVALG